jgi:hypothetical protein
MPAITFGRIGGLQEKKEGVVMMVEWRLKVGQFRS